MKKYAVVVFDFDGVLTVGGEGLKQQAWDILVKLWSYSHQQIFQGQREKYSGGKGSRYDILSETFRLASVDEKDIPLLVDVYADGYNTIVQRLLEQSGMPEGMEQVLAELAKGRELFVNSATPERAVRESVQNFNIAHHFRGIYGRPLSKEDNLARAQHMAHVDSRLMLFVGDSNGDKKAAKDFGCDFVGVANEWNRWEKERVNFPLISSIAELPKLLA